jgi:hypothetical protein
MSNDVKMHEGRELKIAAAELKLDQISGLKRKLPPATPGVLSGS